MFEAKDVGQALGAAELRRAIEVTLEEARAQLFSFVDAVDSAIAREGSLLARSQESPDFFWKHKQLFSSKIKENSDKLFLELRNNQALERLAAKVSEEVRESVLPAVLAKIDASVNWAVAEILPELSTLGHEKATSVRATAFELQQIEKLLLRNQLLTSFRGPARFSFAEYFAELESHLASQAVVFTELDARNVTDEQRATAKELVGLAFKKEAKSQESVIRFIEQRFNELHQPGNWRVRLSHLIPSSQDFGDKRFLHLYRNNWHLVVREVEPKPRVLPLNAYLLDHFNQEASEHPDLTYYDRSFGDEMAENPYEDFEDSQSYYD